MSDCTNYIEKGFSKNASEPYQAVEDVSMISFHFLSFLQVLRSPTGIQSCIYNFTMDRVQQFLKATQQPVHLCCCEVITFRKQLISRAEELSVQLQRCEIAGVTFLQNYSGTNLNQSFRPYKAIRSCLLEILVYNLMTKSRSRLTRTSIVHISSTLQVIWNALVLHLFFLVR